MKRNAFSLHGCFGDHMVLQRDCALRISGTATPGAIITATFRGATKQSVANASGEWVVELPAGPAGGPFELAVADDKGASTLFSDVLVGEVWFCSGQSNMEYPVGKVGPFWGLPNGDAVAADGDDGIRLFQTPRALAPDGPETEPPDGSHWESGANPDAVKAFSAVGWFFGKALRRSLGADVPIGLINSSWGGTNIEPWISRAAYEKGGFTGELNKIEAAIALKGAEPPPPSEAYTASLQGIRNWLRDAFFATDPATTAEALKSWAAPTLPPEEKAKWTRGSRGCLKALATPGVGWFRREFSAPASWTGTQVVLRASGVNDCDEMFVDGAKIGETTIDTQTWWAVQREYAFTLPPSADGRHVLAVRVQNHFCTGSFNGELILVGADGEQLNLADGEWLERLEFRVDSKKAGTRPPVGDNPALSRESPQTPATLFNGMVAPFTPLALRGAIWYQGCNNSGNPEPYADLQDLLVKSWRDAFRNPDLVFIVTQLAAYKAHNPEFRLPDDWWRDRTPEESNETGSFVPLRDAQTRLFGTPGCGVVCAIDVGDHSDIHPSRKRPVGERLAHEALRLAYGDATALPGPRAASATREDANVRVTLRDAAEGLVSAAGTTIPATEHLFALAGDDGSYAWADARIEPDGTLLVASPAVARPIRVEYAWSDFPPEEAQLHRATDGLPLFPFRLAVK